MSDKAQHLIILATSDIHGNFTGYDFFENETAPGGMARLFTCVRKIRAGGDPVLLIDGGDMLAGSLILDRICPRHRDERHPVMEAMNRIGYDAAAVGNHDFDHGTEYLLKAAAQADFPLLAANVRRADGTLFTGRGAVVIERGGLRVAVVGVVTPFVPVMSGGAPGIDRLRFTPGADAVAEALKALDEPFDVLIVSAHMGGYGEYDPERGSDSAWHIADAVPRTDILQMAHTHVIDLGRRGSTVFGEVRDMAQEVLRFDVYTDADGRPSRTEVSLISLADYEPSPEIAELPDIVRIQDETIAYVSGSAGNESGSPVIGEVAETFQPANNEKGVPVARLQETPLTHLFNRVQLEFSGADISACSLADPNCNLEKGPVTRQKLRDIYKYENYLVTVDISGRELKKYLEWSARCFEATDDPVPKVRLSPHCPPFMQDYFAGVSYEIHVRNAPGDRIRNVRVRGEPVGDDQIFLLALPHYRYATTLRKDGMISAEKRWTSGMTIRDMLEDYIARNSPLKPALEGNWKLLL